MSHRARREREGATLNRIREEHQVDTGGRLFRNNVGEAVFEGRDGRKRRVRYGLGTGTSDLVGWTPQKISPEMVGRTVAVFTAYEVKRGSDRLTPDQERFLRAVEAAGGIALTVEEP